MRQLGKKRPLNFLRQNCTEFKRRVFLGSGKHPTELNRGPGTGPVTEPRASSAVPFCAEEMTLSTRRCGFFF